MSADYAPKPRGTSWAVAVVLLIAGLLLGSVIGYYAAPAQTGGPGGPTTVRVIGPWAGAEKDAFLPVMELFETNSGLSYEYITTRQEDLQSLLPNWFAAQRAPADLIFMPSSFVKLYGTQGHAENLAGTLTEADYAPGALDPLKDGADLWGGAYTGKVKPGFWYRKSFFTANALSEPTTWAEFESLLSNISAVPGIQQAIISGDGVGWPLSDVTEHFIATYGGPNMHRQLTTGTLAWTDTSVRDVFANYLVPTLQDGRWSAPRQWDTGVTEWWNGDYGLYFMGSWITGMVPDATDLGVFSLPEAPGAEGIVFAADYFFVPKYAENVAEAKLLAAFLGSATAQTKQVEQGGHLATAVGVPLSAYPAVDAAVAQLLTGKEVLSDLDDTVGGTFQTTFWSELQGLWANPNTLNAVLTNIENARP